MAKITEIPSHCLPQGTLLNGKYEIETVIGAGGFGITYKGHDRLLDIAVAVKEYYPNGYANRYAPAGLSVSISEGNNTKYFIEWKDKFLNEARVLAKFSNVPGIVTVRDYFEENDTAYIVMEYLDGINLKRYVKKNGPFGAEEIGQKMIPLLNSLNKIHSKNLIHRDISPENIMLMPDGTLKLYDFGAARDFANQSGKSMSILLKPGYAPEEQYRSRGKQGPYTDVYALCATMYYCVTGTVPDESVQRVFKDEIKSPSELGVSIPAYIENAIMKGMRIRAEERYQDAAALALALGGNDVSENNIVINNDFDGFDDEGKYDGSVSKRFTKSNMVSRGTATMSKEKQEETSDETVYLTKMKENSVSDETVFLAGAVSAPSDGTAEQEKQTETVSEETTPASPAPAETAPPKKKSKVLIPVICAAACIVLFGGIYLASGAFRNSVPVAEEQTTTSAATEESTVQTTTTAVTTTTSAATTSQTTTSPEMTTAETTVQTTTAETTTGAVQANHIAAVTLFESSLEMLGISSDDLERIEFSKASATSYLREGSISFLPECAIDDTTPKPWVEGADGDGIGESLTLEFSKKNTIDFLCIHPGYARLNENKTGDVFEKNNRPSKIRLDFSDGTYTECELSDLNENIYISFSAPVKTEYVKITVLSVYEGTAYDDTCISFVAAYRLNSVEETTTTPVTTAATTVETTTKTTTTKVTTTKAKTTKATTTPKATTTKKKTTTPTATTTTTVTTTPAVTTTVREIPEGVSFDCGFIDNFTPSASYIVQNDVETVTAYIEYYPPQPPYLGPNEWCCNGIVVTHSNGEIYSYHWGGKEVEWGWKPSWFNISSYPFAYEITDEEGKYGGEKWIATLMSDYLEIEIPVTKGARVDFICHGWEEYDGYQYRVTVVE